jgi:hypothetical protein
MGIIIITAGLAILPRIEGVMPTPLSAIIHDVTITMEEFHVMITYTGADPHEVPETQAQSGIVPHAVQETQPQSGIVPRAIQETQPQSGIVPRAIQAAQPQSGAVRHAVLLVSAH